MLYLEDYLEMIEHLPSELRDRFFDMREMDLSVQNRVDSLSERQKTFFANCSRKLKASEREEEFEKIREEYKKVVEDANEKVQISEECYSLVDRYLRKLDEELLKFKCELEADNRGITEILEKQSLEMDAIPSTATSTSKENRQPKKHKKQNSMDFSLFPTIANDPSFGTSAATSFSPNFGPIPQAASPASTSGTTAASTMSLQHIGVGGNAIAAAASQAIAATQQLSGRRSSSLKASYEAINLGVQANEFSIGRELAGAAQAAIASTSFETQHQHPEQQRKHKNNKSQQPDLLGSSPVGGYLDVLGGQDNSNASFGGPPGPEQDWNFDPNEPRYCICNQVSYGDMVACDNDDCPYEWFHYPCVGITAPPKGKWFCPKCQANMARRKSRK